MSSGLQAPAAIPVEVRAAQRRVFRLSRAVGDAELRLERPVPFEVGRPVEISFTLPDGDAPLTLRAEVRPTGDPAEEEGTRGGCALLLLDPPHDARDAIGAYVARRLGLPARH